VFVVTDSPGFWRPVAAR